MIKQIIQDLWIHRNTDMLDKTKCSVTAKNIYNYLVSKYGNQDQEQTQIAWNDTLNTGTREVQTLQEFESWIQIQNNKDKNTVFYVYYDHITGETSHYFIILILNKGMYVFQSAVFEYSIAEWLFDYTEPEIVMGDSDDPERNYYTEFARKQRLEQREQIRERINQSLLNRRNKGDVYLRDLMPMFSMLEGPWSENCLQKCEIFTKLFACKMDPLRYSKLFSEETKIAKFKFTWCILNV